MNSIAPRVLLLSASVKEATRLDPFHPTAEANLPHCDVCLRCFPFFFLKFRFHLLGVWACFDISSVLVIKAILIAALALELRGISGPQVGWNFHSEKGGQWPPSKKYLGLDLGANRAFELVRVSDERLESLGQLGCGARVGVEEQPELRLGHHAPPPSRRDDLLVATGRRGVGRGE